MKKILFVYENEFLPTKGGIERVTSSIAESLQKKGYSIEYLVLNKGVDQLPESKIKTYYFPETKKTNQLLLFYWDFLKKHNIEIVINQSGIHGASKIFTNKGDSNAKIISYIHTNPLKYYNSFSQTAKVPLEYSFKGYFRQLITILFYPIVKLVFKQELSKRFSMLMKTSDAVCVLSKRFEQEILSIYKGDLSKIHYIPNPNTFEESQIIESQKKKQIIYVGRLIAWQKDPMQLIKIWERVYEQLPDWELLILGDGPERERMERYSQSLSRVRYLGFCNPLPYYAEASILCLTSNSEGWGMTIAEAMQFGVVPIVYDSYSSVKDIIEDNHSGILVHKNNEWEFADKLLSLVKDEKRTKEISLNAIECIKRYNIENIIPLWTDLMRRL